MTGEPPSGAGRLRAGDEERSSCAAQLAESFATGRLSLVEHEARLTRALVAVTTADLADLVADLPVTPDRAGSGVQPRPSATLLRLLGLLVFQFVLVVVAFGLGVDLESEATSAFVISVEVWAVGTASGAAGLVAGRGRRRLLRPAAHPGERTP